MCEITKADGILKRVGASSVSYSLPLTEQLLTFSARLSSRRRFSLSSFYAVVIDLTMGFITQSLSCCFG